MSKMAASISRLRLCRRSFLFQQHRQSSVVATVPARDGNEEQDSLYPAIKPKYPPGEWGGMEPSYAWLWQKSKEESLAIPDASSRAAALCDTKLAHLSLLVKDKRPRILEYKKYMTKTHLMPGLPEMYGTLNAAQLDSLTAQLAPLVCDVIVMETEQLQRAGLLRKFKKKGDQHDEILAHTLLRSLLTNLITQLSSIFPHLLTAQYDENVSVSALWDRHGIKRDRKKMITPDYYKYITVDDQRLFAQSSLDFVLRSDKPLPEFVGRDSELSVESEVPEMKFQPSAFGGLFSSQEKRSVEAGHKWGDPCEFGLLSVLNTAWTKFVGEKYGPKYAAEAVLAQAVTSSFVWLAAQAHNQGFNTFIDLTYPLTCQSVLTDGQRWQFTAYQLNTMELWKDNAGNGYSNLCWAGDQEQLFTSVEEGKVQGFNPDVLRQLITFLSLAPVERPYNMKPTLPATAPRPEQRTEFVPLKKEKAVVVEEEKYV